MTQQVQQQQLSQQGLFPEAHKEYPKFTCYKTTVIYAIWSVAELNTQTRLLNRVLHIVSKSA